MFSAMTKLLLSIRKLRLLKHHLVLKRGWIKVCSLLLSEMVAYKYSGWIYNHSGVQHWSRFTLKKNDQNLQRNFLNSKTRVSPVHPYLQYVATTLSESAEELTLLMLVEKKHNFFGQPAVPTVFPPWFMISLTITGQKRCDLAFIGRERQ